MSDSKRVEIGYVCGHGHYVFYGDEDACGSKRTAGIFVEREVEFYESYEEADEDGHVWFTSCGYSEEEYLSELEDAKRSLLHKIAVWRREDS